MHDIDKCFAAFEAVALSYDEYRDEKLSEADTRSKIVDKILIDCLGWSENDIDREGHNSSGYYDYRVNLPGFSFLVEAKRGYDDLILSKGSEKVTLRTLLTGNRPVIEQIRKYCIARDLAHGVITNGRQFIICQFVNSNGKSWESNKALVFNGFEDIKKRFTEFYDNLSRFSVQQSGGIKYVLSSDVLEGHNLLRDAAKSNSHISRNSIASSLALAIDQIFGELFSEENEKETDFIKECFVENTESKKNREEIEKLFEDSAPDFPEVVPAKNFGNIAGQIEDNLASGHQSRLSGAPPKPIIIIGTKGAGKTTFMNYLWKYKLDERTVKSHPYVYVDFRNYLISSKFDSEQVSADIIEKLYEMYGDYRLHTIEVQKRVYHKEIRYKDEGVWSTIKLRDPARYEIEISSFISEKLKNSVNHLQALGKYLAHERGIRLVIIIDNCDQFPENIQRDVYMYSQAVSRAGKCGIMLALREGFYHRFRSTPTVNAYEDHVYHISAPNYQEILQKRILYTIKKISNDNRAIHGISEGGSKVQVDKTHIIEFLSSVEHNILNETNKEIIEYINETTYPDIREGLRVFRAYLTSGYTNVDEIVFRELNRAGRSDKMPTTRIFEFVKSIALGNRLHYKHEGSYLVNLFYPSEGSRDYFIRLRIMKWLAKEIKAVGWSRLYHEKGRIKDFFDDLGYRKSKIDIELQRLLRYGMIDTDSVVSDIDTEETVEDSARIALTRKGYFYLTNVCKRFYYLDLVVMDTPIYERIAYEQILSAFPEPDVHGKRVLDRRIEVAEMFFEYLKKEEKYDNPRVLSNNGSICTDLIEPVFKHDIAALWQRLKNKI